MKHILILAALLVLTNGASAVTKLQLDLRANKLIAKFEQMQQKPDKRIPPDVLQKAQAIILLDRTKAGFIFAFQGGGGLAMAKDKDSGQWGPIAFLKATEASLGLQIGGQQSFLVILLLNREAVRLLTDPTFEFGGEARGTAGDASGGVNGTISSVEKPVVIYDDRKGLYGGAALKGGAMTPDEEANLVYYESPLLMKEIVVDHKVKPTAPALALAKKISEHSVVPAAKEAPDTQSK